MSLFTRNIIHTSMWDKINWKVPNCYLNIHNKSHTGWNVNIVIFFLCGSKNVKSSLLTQWIYNKIQNQGRLCHTTAAWQIWISELQYFRRPYARWIFDFCTYHIFTMKCGKKRNWIFTVLLCVCAFDVVGIFSTIFLFDVIDLLWTKLNCGMQRSF